MIPFPVFRIPVTPVHVARAKTALQGSLALVVLSVWTGADWNDESVPPPPIEVVEAVPAPVRPAPGPDVLTLRQDLSALLNTESLRRAEWSVLVVSLEN